MKLPMPAMILFAVSTPIVWAADTPQPKAGSGDVDVQVQVLDGAGGAKKLAGNGVETKAFVIRISPDGKAEVKDALPPDVEKLVQEARLGDRSKEETKQDDKAPGSVAKGMDVRGSISVFGPGGVVYSQEFGAAGEALPDVEQLLEQSLKAAGADLPEDVRQALEDAFRKHGHANNAPPEGEAANVASKLDQILARLEKIEQQISRLHD